jgi:LysR family transcriptional regulator, benzoate and cis,cis-muconate-responsive activator of ben and cat genes
MRQLEAVAAQPPGPADSTPQNVELRHLRYFVAVADAGTFTEAAERMFVAQPTLSQQLRRLEDIVGTQLLHRRREGVRLTMAGAVLLETSRAILSLVDHGVSQTRQAAGLGRQRLRVVVPPRLPDALAVETASRLMSAAVAANVDVTWVEVPLDNEFSLIRQRKADAGLGWLPGAGEDLPAPFDVMSLGEFEPMLWIPSWHPAAGRGTLTVEELTRMTVVYGPRRAEAGTYDRWSGVLRAADPGFAFTDPPFRHSLPMSVAFAGNASRPTAVLTSPCIAMGSAKAAAREQRLTHAYDMVEVSLERHPLVATAGLVWNTDLPRPLQQILFDAADGLPRISLGRDHLLAYADMPGGAVQAADLGHTGQHRERAHVGTQALNAIQPA